MKLDYIFSENEWNAPSRNENDVAAQFSFEGIPSSPITLSTPTQSNSMNLYKPIPLVTISTNPVTRNSTNLFNSISSSQPPLLPPVENIELPSLSSTFPFPSPQPSPHSSPSTSVSFSSHCQHLSHPPHSRLTMNSPPSTAMGQVIQFSSSSTSLPIPSTSCFHSSFPERVSNQNQLSEQQSTINNSYYMMSKKLVNGKQNRRKSKLSLPSCVCQKSLCSKRYCPCYKSGRLCSDNCQCVDCHNREHGIFYV